MLSFERQNSQNIDMAASELIVRQHTPQAGESTYHLPAAENIDEFHSQRLVLHAIAHAKIDVCN